ncbi:hypothetical protein LZ30DRAFT_724520 [Colletotrichum cereale]|nr:hypothetical protein LZ30DRAFT_724520 [Colletotrichum cereale]
MPPWRPALLAFLLVCGPAQDKTKGRRSSSVAYGVFAGTKRRENGRWMNGIERPSPTYVRPRRTTSGHHLQALSPFPSAKRGVDSGAHTNTDTICKYRYGDSLRVRHYQCIMF